MNVNNMKRRIPEMKKYLTPILCGVCALLIASCGDSTAVTDETQARQDGNA